MKRFITCCALLGLVVLTACSGDSPSPRPLPTPAPDTWAIPSLTVDNADPYVNVGVYITATVTKNGEPAPDGTAVEFIATGGSVSNETGFFVAFNSPVAIVATEGGQATILFVASTPGPVAFRVRVVDAYRQVGVVYRVHDPSDTLQIFLPLRPDAGSRFGGEEVTLVGKGITPPAEVFFTAGGATYPAEVLLVVPSEPLSATGSITVRTPQMANLLDDLCSEYRATVEVRVGVGTSNEQAATYVDAFLFLAEDVPECDPSPPEPGCPSAPEIYLLVPDRGTPLGGEQVTIFGRNFGMYWDEGTQQFLVQTEGSVRVEFITPDRTLRGIDPVVSADGRQISVTTPRYGTQPIHADVIAAVKVTSLVDRDPDACGTDELSDTKTDAFVFEAQLPECPDAPEVYLVSPGRGAPTGGEQVTIFGRNFGMYWDEDAQEFRVQTVNSVLVEFIAPDRTLRGIDPVVSPDGSQITVTTPRYSAVTLDEDVIVAVRVTSLVDRDPDVCGTGELSDTKPEAFVFYADEPTPDVLAVAPTAGPLDGGTVVTIFGHGFQFPLQVMFGNLEAIVNEVNDDTSAVDNDTIICVTPDYSTQGQTPPVAVDVEVTNINSGLNATLAGGFTYGANLFISGNTPTRGGRGTVVTIYGNGFEDPLQVDFLGAGTIRLETVAVSGTEVIARFPDDETPECQDTTASFRITLPELPPEQGVVEGGSFTYLGLNPVVISVDPPIVQETLGGAGVSPMEVVIYGQRFTDEALVEIRSPDPLADGYIIPSQYVDVISDTQIQVSQLPSPNDFGLDMDCSDHVCWQTSPCVTPQGQNGDRPVATPLNVIVTNIPGDCSDTLVGGIIYEPQTSECTVGAEIRVDPDDGGENDPVDLGSAPHGNCTAPLMFTITANSAADLEIQTMNLVGRFFFWNGGLAGQSYGPRTVPAFGTTTVDIVFCPDVNNNLDYSGVFVIRSNGDTDPKEIYLSGTEMQPIVAATPTSLALSTGTPVGQIELANTGDIATWTTEITGTGAGEFSITAGATGTLAALIGVQNLQVTFTNPTGVGSYSANVEITWVDPDNPTITGMIPITVTGTNP